MKGKAAKSTILPEGWREVRLGDVCSIDSRTLSSKTPDDYCFDYISLSDVDRGKLLQTQKYKYSDAPSRARRMVTKGDVLLATVRPNLQGFYVFRKEINDCIVSTGFAVLSPQKDRLDSLYLYQALFSHYMLATYYAFNVGSNYPAVNSSDISKFKIAIPTLTEQKAIASVLQTWDTAIEKTEALIAAKEKQFKWLLKRLISDQQNNPECHKTNLGNLFEIKTHPSKSKYKNENGKYVVVDMGAVSRNGELLDIKRTNLKDDLLSVEDLVMPKDDIGGGNIIGKVAIIEQENKYVCGDHIYRLIKKQGNSAHFLRFVINSFVINKQLRAKANGTAQLGLGKQEVLKQEISLPSLAEQQRVTNILTLAQKEISLLELLTETYRTQKRGLMQKLLAGEWSVGPKNLKITGER